MRALRCSLQHQRTDRLARKMLTRAVVRAVVLTLPKRAGRNVMVVLRDVAPTEGATSAASALASSTFPSRAWVAASQTRPRLNGPAGQVICPVKRSRVQMVVIQRVDPGAYVRPGKPGVGARVIGVDRKGLLQETPHLVELGRSE
jgi:hypothetical protein